MAQPQPVYRIAGAQGTGIYPRLELRELQKKPIHFSLFVRAMAKLHNMTSVADRAKANSWWQIGSIHGLPYDPYSGDPEGPQKDVSDKQWEGYCYHSSALFPPWHRVLLLLIEQAIINEATAIATEFEAKNPIARKEGWVQAAKELRFPFWDWTKPETATEGIPKACQDPKISIVNPGGLLFVQDPNPLNHYKFAASPGLMPALPYMQSWERTYRWTEPVTKPTKEDYNGAVKAFSSGGKLQLGPDVVDLQPVTWLREKVAGLFTYDLTLEDPAYGPNMWAYFSNTGAAAPGNVVSPPMAVMPPSVEESHNTVHVDVGGIGSMSAFEYAAFDPIFFMHHANVDRIYAFWEYLYPEYWIGEGWKNKADGKIVPFITQDGTYWEKAGSTIDHATPLHPFRNNDSAYWTSDQVRSLLNTHPVNKYYTYPPIINPLTGDKVQVDTPYDPKDLNLRRRYQQVLLGEWGRDLGSIMQTHQNLPFELPFLDLLLKLEDGLANLRQFVVVGLIPEFAYSGTYRLELYLLPKIVQLASGLLKGATGVLEQVTGLGAFGLVQQGVQAAEDSVIHVLNNITVVGRADPDRCGACRERRAAGNQIRGYMHLDPRAILYMIASLDPTALGAITALDHVSALIQGSIGMRLVRPDGSKLAAAEPDFLSQPTLNESQLPKLEISSRVLSFDPKDPAAPVLFSGHQTHGTFAASHGWKTF